MATFNAGELIEPLKWTFKPFVDAEGTITEPSDQKISDFMDAIKGISTDAAKLEASAQKMIAGLGTEDPEKIAEVIADLPTESLLVVMGKLAEAYSALCTGHPTKAQILKLPLRARVLFFDWLQREVVNPEAGSGGGTAKVISLPAAAGGSSST